MDRSSSRELHVTFDLRSIYWRGWVVIGVLLAMVATGCSTGNGDASPSETGSTSETPEPEMDPLTYGPAPGLCGQLDWSAIEAYAPFQSPNGDAATANVCERMFDDGDEPRGGLEADLYLKVTVTESIADAEAIDGENLDLVNLPFEEDAVISPVEGWDSSYLAAAGRRCVFIGQDDNLSIVFDLTLAIEGIASDEVPQEDLVELVMDIVDEARELSRA